MFNHQHRVARIDQALQHVEQLANVLKVKTGRRLIQNVERLARLASMKLLGELHALRLATRKRRRGLAKAHIAKAHVIQGLKLALDLRDIPKEGQCLGNAHVEHIRDGLAAIGNLKRLTVVTLTAADLARNVDVRQEMHLDLNLSVALACFAATAAHVKGETSRRVAARLRLRRTRKQRAKIIPQANVRSRVGTRRAANRRLVDIDNLIDTLDALDFLIRTHRARRTVNGIRKGRCDGVGNQGALTRSRHAGNNRKRTKLDLGGNVFEVVGAGARDLKAAATGFAAFFGHTDHPLAGQIGARHRFGTRHDIGRRSCRNHVSAVNARTGAHIDHVVGSANRILIVLDDDNGIADIAQALKCLDQAFVVALMKTNRRLIQNVQNAHESGADLSCQANALGLTAGKRRRGAIERQIIESDIDQKTQTLQDFLDDAAADKLLALGELQALKKLERLTARQATDLINRLTAHGDGKHLGTQTGAMAARARLLANVLLQACLGVLVRRLGVALIQDVAHAREFGIPLAATPVELLIVDRNLRVAHAIQKRTTHPRGQVLPWRVGAHLKVLADRGKDLRIVVGVAEQAAKDSVGNRL